MQRALFTTARRRRSAVARAAGLAMAGILSIAAAGCHDEVTGPTPLAPRSALDVLAPVAPTPLATPGAASGSAIDINDAGVVVGRIVGETGTTRIVLWYPSGVMDTAPLGSAVGIGNDGRVGGNTAGGVVAVWNSTTDAITSAAGPYIARAMSPGGGVVVGDYDRAPTPSCSNTHAGFTWTPGIFTPVDMGCAVGWPAITPTGVNGAATAVGNVQRFAPPASRAFVWSFSGGIQLIGSSSSVAEAINGSGTIVGTDAGQAATIGGSSAVPLAPELGATRAVAINDKNEVVIRSTTSAWLKRGNSLVPLASLGGCCVAAFAVNERSQVVGQATTPAGVWRPVIWDVAGVVQPLVANAGGPYTGLEGSAVAFTGSATGATATPTFAWTFGDGATATGMSTSNVYADEGMYAVTLTVGADGRVATAATTATIANVAPTVTVASGATIWSGETFTVRGRFEDPGVRDDPWAWQLRDGALEASADGSASQTPDSVIVPVVLRRAGVHVLTLRVTDEDGGAGAATTTVTVQRLPVPIYVTPSRQFSATRGKGLLTIALHSTERVNVATIDIATVRLSGIPLATRGDGGPMATLQEVDADGTMELVLKFERSALPPGPTLLLTADLKDGRQIAGTWTW